MNVKRLVLILSLAAGFSFPAQAVPSALDLAGRWETTIEFGKMKIKIAVTVKQLPDGKIEGKIDMPEQGARDVPVNAMLLNYPAVRWEIDPFNTAFSGKVNEAGDEIAGAFEEGPGGRPITVAFKRVQIKDQPKPVFSFASGEAPDFRGYWEGLIDSEIDRVSRVSLRIGRLPDQSYSAELDLFDRGQEKLPASSVTSSNSTLKLEWQFQQITFSGQLADQGDLLKGQWSFGPRTSAIALKRLDHPATILPPNVSFTPQPENPRDIRGVWKGALDAQGNKIHLILRLGQTTDGAFAGTLASPDQGGGEIPATSVGYTNPLVRVDFKRLNGVFSGKLNPEGTRMDGSWKQGGPPLELQLTRAALAEKGKP